MDAVFEPSFLRALEDMANFNPDTLELKQYDCLRHNNVVCQSRVSALLTQHGTESHLHFHQKPLYCVSIVANYSAKRQRNITTTFLQLFKVLQKEPELQSPNDLWAGIAVTQEVSVQDIHFTRMTEMIIE
jgi:hypothetical protein